MIGTRILARKFKLYPGKGDQTGRGLSFFLPLEDAIFQVSDAVSEMSFAPASKRVFVKNHSYENVFYLRVHFRAN